MIVRELAARLGLDVQDAGFKKAESMLGGLRSNLLSFGVAAVSAIGAAAAGIVKSTAEAADGILKLSQRTGVESQALQEFAYAAELADVSTEELAQGMRFLAKSGVRDVRAEMLKLAEQFQSMPDDGAKVALAIQKFGRSGAQLIPMLNGGSEALASMAAEARALGLVFGESDQKAAEEFNDELTRLGKTFTGIKNAIGLALIEPLTKAITVARTWLATLRPTDLERLRMVLQGLAFVMGGVLVAALVAGAAALWSFAVAWVAAAAPVLLVGAAIGAVLLILEDLYQFLTGGESVIGDFVAYVKREFGSWENFFYSLLKWMGSLFDEFWDWLLGGFKDIGKAILGVFDDINRAVKDAMLSAAKKALRIASVLPGGVWASELLKTEAFGGGAAPAASVSAGVNTKAPKINAPQFRADITVNAAPGMSVQEVAGAVSTANEDWWNSKMRETAAGVE